MTTGKSSKLWGVNVASFILFIILCSTGLVNWLILPRGFETRESLLVFFRHFFIAVHEWTAVIFIIVVAIHISLHRQYIKSNLRKYGIMGSPKI